MDINTAKTGITTEQAADIANTKTIAIQNSTTLTNKVDKITGKGLSANDFTNDLKTKLDNLSNTIIIDNLTSTSTSDALSANQGRVLKSLVDGVLPSGGSDGQVLKTDGSGNYTWVTVANHIIGEIKQSIGTMPAGWVKLEGQAISSLTATQQTAAASLSLTGNLPNATNAYLSQTSGSLGSVVGENTETIMRNNLPDFVLSGNTAVAGNHSHSLATGTYNQLIRRSPNNDPTTIRGVDGTRGELDLVNSVAFRLNNAGNHTHSFTTPSINGGVPQQGLDITPKTLSVNTYIYLGQ